MMLIVPFGPPGVGKGTISKLLEEKFGYKHISTGDIFRDEIRSGSELGQKIKAIIEAGELVPDEIVFEIVKKMLDKLFKEHKVVILDGYPRTVKQAELLEKYRSEKGIKMCIVNLDMNRDVLMERLLGRRVCPKCKANYNVANIDKVVDGIRYYFPPLAPKHDEICDNCGTKLEKRKDDTPETIKKRLEVYDEETKPVLNFYDGKVPVINLIVHLPPKETLEELTEELKKTCII